LELPGTGEVPVEEDSELSFKNIAVNASTDYAHVLFVTPAMLHFLIEEKEFYGPFDINPRLLVFEHIDALLTYKGLREPTEALLKLFTSASDPLLARANKQRQALCHCENVVRLHVVSGAKPTSGRAPVDSAEKVGAQCDTPAISIAALHPLDRRVNLRKDSECWRVRTNQIVN
jgi:hypothetical protein